MRKKTLLFSVTMKDLEMQTFTVSGHGGGGKDTSNTGVRLIHRLSGAVGEGREERSQKANKRRAFERMAATDRFQKWVRLEAARRMGKIDTPEEIYKKVDLMIEQGLQDGTIKIEEF